MSSLFHQLMEKPWVTEQGTVTELHSGRTFFLPTAKLGLRVFLAVVIVVFSLLIVVYADRMTYGDWHALPEPWLLWLNTAILILSSVSLHWAWVSAGKGQAQGVIGGLLAGGVFAFAFLIGQVVVSQQLVALGYFASSDPANGFFYMITGIHAVHLLGGLVAWGRTVSKFWRGFGVARLRLSIELCAIYWHFLLVIWLVLFGLLLFT